MKLASTAAVALALGLVAGAAQAQPPDHHDDKKAPPRAPAAQPAPRPGAPSAYRPGNNRYNGGAAIGSQGTGIGAGKIRPDGFGAGGHYNGQNLPHQFQAQQRFRVAPRYYPNGWYAHRWAYGETLPWGWYAPQFFLAWDNYGLPEPPPGCDWVQEGSDAVLVDLSSGQVLSVEYGVFWW